MNNDDIAATEPSSGSPVGTLMRLVNLQAELTHTRSKYDIKPTEAIR
jgi:hypothetical protein